MQTEAVEAKGRKTPRALKDARYSKDGKWRLFPQDSNLLQYVSTGMFYGRVKVSGKPIRKKLGTDVYTTAKLKLLDFLKEQTQAPPPPAVPVLTFGEAQRVFEVDLANDPTFSPKTVEYKKFNLKLIARTWPELAKLPLDEITTSSGIEWAGRLSKEVSAEAYNHTIGVFKAVFERGLKENKEKGGKPIENPWAAIRRLGVKPKKLQLPEPKQFSKLVDAISNAGGGFSKRCADWGFRVPMERSRHRSGCVLWLKRGTRGQKNFMAANSFWA